MLQVEQRANRLCATRYVCLQTTLDIQAPSSLDEPRRRHPMRVSLSPLPDKSTVLHAMCEFFGSRPEPETAGFPHRVFYLNREKCRRANDIIGQRQAGLAGKRPIAMAFPVPGVERETAILRTPPSSRHVWVAHHAAESRPASTFSHCRKGRKWQLALSHDRPSVRIPLRPAGVPTAAAPRPPRFWLASR